MSGKPKRKSGLFASMSRSFSNASRSHEESKTRGAKSNVEPSTPDLSLTSATSGLDTAAGSASKLFRTEAAKAAEQVTAARTGSVDRGRVDEGDDRDAQTAQQRTESLDTSNTRSPEQLESPKLPRASDVNRPSSVSASPIPTEASLASGDGPGSSHARGGSGPGSPLGARGPLKFVHSTPNTSLQTMPVNGAENKEAPGPGPDHGDAAGYTTNLFGGGPQKPQLSADVLDFDDNQDSTMGPREIQWAVIHLIAVGLKEATIDSPTFRASAEHFDLQIRALESWVKELYASVMKFSKEMDLVREKINGVIAMFVPPFAHENILHQDYTNVLFERYTQGLNSYWVSIITVVKTHEREFGVLLKEWLEGPYAAYKSARHTWEGTKLGYETLLNDYASMSKRAPSEQVKNVATQVYQARRHHLSNSLNLCEATSILEIATNKLVVSALSRPFQLNKGVTTTSIKDLEIGIDLHRLNAYVGDLELQFRLTRTDFERAKKESSEQIHRSRPSSKIEDYAVLTRPVTGKADGTAAPELYGWLFVKNRNARSSRRWQRVWAFVKGGLFGYLVQSPDRTYVQEVEKSSVLLLTTRSTDEEDRRFCFVVMDSDQSTVFQAETNSDMQSWLDAIESAKRTHKEDKISEDGEAAKNLLPSYYAYNPPFDSESSGASGSIQRSGSTRSVNRSAHQVLGKEAGQLRQFLDKYYQGLLDELTSPSSTSGSSAMGTSAYSLAPRALCNRPLATSKTIESIVSGAYINPGRVPNALTANYWGSVNWSTFQDAELPVLSSAKKPLYPSYYPRSLRFQDMDLHAIFEGLSAPLNDEDRVIMVLRCFVVMEERKCIPARVFVTPNRVFVYSHWMQFSGLLAVDLEDTISVETYPGKDHDDIRFVSRRNNVYKMTTCRYYIDSASLAQRRIQFLIDNRRASSPLGLKAIIEELTRIGKDYESEVSSGLSKMVALKGFPAKDPELLPSADFTEDDVADKSNDWIDTYLVHNIPRSPRGVQLNEQKVAKNTSLVLEKTYNVPPKILYYTMFGDKSPVFLAAGTKNKTLPWYFKKRTVERRIPASSQWLQSFEPLSGKVSATQQIGRSQENRFYSIIEIGPIFELPRGSQFFVISWFILTGSKSRSRTKILVYESIVWIKEFNIVKNITETMITQYVTQRVENHLNCTSDALAQLSSPPTLQETSQKYGRVKGSILRIDQFEEDNSSVSAWRIHGFDYYFLLFWTPLMTIAMSIPDLARTLLRFMTANGVIVMLLCASVLFNMFLSARVGAASWSAYWKVHKAEKYAKSISLELQPGSAFVRHIYSGEVTDAIRSGDLIREEFNMSADGLVNGQNNLCYSKYLDISRAATLQDEFNKIQLDGTGKELMLKIAHIRTNGALERNRLLVQLRKLDTSEKEKLLEEWRLWLIGEIGMCSRARAVLPQLDRVTAGAIKEYCIDCANVGQYLL